MSLLKWQMFRHKKWAQCLLWLLTDVEVKSDVLQTVSRAILGILPTGSADTSATHGSKILKVPSTVTHRSWPFTYSLMYRFACMRRPSFKMCSRQKTSMYFLSFPLITSGQWDPLGRLPYFHLRCFVILWQAISISHYSITYSVKLWLWVILPDRVVHLSLC